MAEKKQSEQKPQRVTPQQAREHIEAGALLVCAYDDVQKCEKYALQGAITLDELKSRDNVANDRELIFYCA